MIVVVTIVKVGMDKKFYYTMVAKMVAILVVLTYATRM